MFTGIGFVKHLRGPPTTQEVAIIRGTVGIWFYCWVVRFLFLQVDGLMRWFPPYFLLRSSQAPAMMLFMFLSSAVSINTYGFVDNFYLDAATPEESLRSGYPACDTPDRGDFPADPLDISGISFQLFWITNPDKNVSSICV